LPLEKIKAIAEDADISFPLELFWKIYRKATKKKHSFLYLDTGNEQLRRNFNEKFIINEPDEEDDEDDDNKQ